MNRKITLAEIEFTLRKSARATGLDWGICEEAGKSARWLAAFGLPGPELLLAHLLETENKIYSDLIPDCGRSPWHSPSRSTCPIAAGAALADRSSRMLAGEIYELLNVSYPLLLAAIVGQAARFHRAVFTTAWAGVSVSCYRNGIRIQGDRHDLWRDTVDSLSCQREDDSEPQQLPSTRACIVAEETWQEITSLAYRTYAPATEESRAGAGAGLTDND